MEEEHPNQQNKYLEYLVRNKYNVYFIGAITILFILIISMITIIALSKTAKKSSTVPNQSPIQPSPSQEVSQTPSTTFVSHSPSPSSIPITTPNPTEAAVIEDQTKQQILSNSNVPYTVTNTTLYGDNWGTMAITSQSIGGEGVIIQKVNGKWNVVEGPGTFFPPALLESINAPQALIDSFYPPISPTPEP
jgi:hypothetical protein